MRLLARLYLFCYRLYARFAGGVKTLLGIGKAVHAGWWLGVLPERALAAVDELFFVRDAVYASREHNLAGLTGWETEVVERFFAVCRRVAVLAAGAGREVIALQRRGVEAKGWECNPHLVAVAGELLAEAGVAGEVVLSPRDVCPALGGQWDGVIVGWSAYMHVMGRARRVTLLRGIAEHLPEGGPVLLSFFVLGELAGLHRLTYRVARPIRWVLRRAPAELGDVLDPNFQHYFSEAEVREELEAAGFRMAHFSREGYGHAVGLKRGSGADQGQED